MVGSNEGELHETFAQLAGQVRVYEERLEELNSKKKRVATLQFELVRRFKAVISPMLYVLGPQREISLGRNWVLTGSGFAVKTEGARKFGDPSIDQIDAEFLRPLGEQLFELSEEINRRTSETGGQILTVDPLLADLETWAKVFGIENES